MPRYKCHMSGKYEHLLKYLKNIKKWKLNHKPGKLFVVNLNSEGLVKEIYK